MDTDNVAQILTDMQDRKHEIEKQSCFVGRPELCEVASLKCNRTSQKLLVRLFLPLGMFRHFTATGMEPSNTASKVLPLLLALRDILSLQGMSNLDVYEVPPVFPLVLVCP